MTELRTPARRELPDLDAEQEIDLGRVWRALGERWWLPALGVLAGLLIGYLLALGGSQVYRAKTTLYLGTPLSPTGSAPVPSLNTNPRTVATIVRSESALKEAASRAGLHVRQLRGKVSSSAVSTGTAATGAARGTQAQLVEIAVKGRAPHKIEVAADALGEVVISRVSGYVDTKIATFKQTLAGQLGTLASLDERIALENQAIRRSNGLSPLDKLVLVSQLDNAEQRRGVLLSEKSDTQQLLSLAQNVEKARVVTKAAAVKTTARSKRNSMLVVGFIGLILGMLAALLWEPVATRLGRRSAV